MIYMRIHIHTYTRIIMYINMRYIYILYMHTLVDISIWLEICHKFRLSPYYSPMLYELIWTVLQMLGNFRQVFVFQRYRATQGC